MAGNNRIFNPAGCIKTLFPECVAQGEQCFYAPQGIENSVITQHLSDVTNLSYTWLIIPSRSTCIFSLLLSCDCFQPITSQDFPAKIRKSHSRESEIWNFGGKKSHDSF